MTTAAEGCLVFGRNFWPLVEIAKGFRGYWGNSPDSWNISNLMKLGLITEARIPELTEAGKAFYHSVKTTPWPELPLSPEAWHDIKSLLHALLTLNFYGFSDQPAWRREEGAKTEHLLKNWLHLNVLAINRSGNIYLTPRGEDLITYIVNRDIMEFVQKTSDEETYYHWLLLQYISKENWPIILTELEKWGSLYEKQRSVWLRLLKSYYT